MSDLGNKHDCYSCGAKFYDLGKPEPLCPKCGANQKDARRQDAAAEVPHAKRRRKAEVVRPAAATEDDDLATPAADVDFADDDLVTPEGSEDDEAEADDDLDDEE